MDEAPRQELIPVDESGSLIDVEKACLYLRAAKNVGEVKDIADKASAIAYYARKSELTREAYDDACELKLWAEKRLGELLADMPKQKPGQYQRSHDATVAPSLSELGIDKYRSSRCQKIATIPDEVFDDRIKQTRVDGDELTTQMMLRLAAELNKADQSEKQFNVLLERDAIEKWLLGRVENWPEERRHFFPQIIEQITEKLQRQCNDRRGPWRGCTSEGEGADGGKDSCKTSGSGDGA